VGLSNVNIYPATPVHGGKWPFDDPSEFRGEILKKGCDKDSAAVFVARVQILASSGNRSAYYVTENLVRLDGGEAEVEEEKEIFAHDMYGILE